VTTTLAPEPSFLRSQVSGLPKPFWALWSGTLVNRLGAMVLPFTGVYLTHERGFSVTESATALAVFGAGSLISQFAAGSLADRVGRRATLVGGMVATSLMMMALGYSTSPTAILVSMFLLGLVMDAYRPASNAMIADLVSPENRPKAYGMLFWAMNVGYAVGMTAGGWLAGAGIMWLFWINAASCVAFAVLVWRAVPETRPERGTHAEEGFGAVLRDRLMLAFTAVALGNAFVYSQTMSTLPLMMMPVLKLNEKEFGTTMAINGILIVLVQPLVSGWLSRRDHSRTLALGIAILSVGFALTAFVTSPLTLGVTIVIWTCGEIVTAGIAGTILATLAPAHLRGRYAGVFGFAWSLSLLLAPLSGGVLIPLGPYALWFAIGAVGLLTAAAQLAIGPAIRRRAALSIC